MELLKSLSRELNEGGGDVNLIDENIWGITFNDDNEPVTLSIWFKGDKRDGVQEVFWKCDNPPSDIDNKAALLDLIWDKTGMTSHDFKNAKFIRIYDATVEKELEQVLPKLATEDLDDLQIILSLAQAAAETVDPERKTKRFPAIERWSSRATTAKAKQLLKARA